MCDRFYTLLRIRAVTFGEPYEFNIPKCADPDCNERIEWEVLLNDLPFKALPPESIATFKNGNRFSATLPSGGKITYQLLTGKLEVAAGRSLRAHRDEAVTTALQARITAVEGISGRAAKIGGKPYYIGPAINASEPEVERLYLEGIDAMSHQAFPT